MSSPSIRKDLYIRTVQIPDRVRERKHCMTDELTGLAETLNKILDELTIQYNLLEEQVAELTQKLGKRR
jgi:osomolarity two-component system sensor histidine kinase SLN1